MRRTAVFVAAGLVVALVVAAGAHRIASTEPGGLERVAADQAIGAGEQPHALEGGPFADYSTRGVDDPGVSAGVAGVTGVLVTFSVAGGVAWMAARSSRRRAA